MKKDDYIKITKDKLNDVSANIMFQQIENYFEAKNSNINFKKYNIGDDVFLTKGTLLHGTYKNIDGLKEIVKDGVISSWFIDGRGSKYPSSIGVWNLKQDYYLKDYINHYSGGTIKYYDRIDGDMVTEVIDFNEMPKIMDKIISKGFLVWNIEQTKEARFMPSLVQNKIQIGIIFNGNNNYVKKLLRGDILNPDNINDLEVKGFVNEEYYDQFIVYRKNKDDFFTDRESAILFGLPSCLIEGILVGRDYEKDENILNQIKGLLPNCYICNLDGKVIK